MQATTLSTPSHAGRRVRTTLVMLAGAAVFLGIASVVNPKGPRSASADSFNATQVLATPTHPKGWKLIGSLVNAEHELRCWATPLGPRYSVHTLDGRLLQDNLLSDDVYRAFPDIELEHLRADPPESRSIMTADTPQPD
jgi:hypothetical protein